MSEMRYSRQREAILSYLKSTHCHPTAETVYDSVRKEFPNLSLGTVYRNLGQLVEQGSIANITFADGIVHYDYDTSPHHHFLCRRCGCIQDMPWLLQSYQMNHPEVEEFSGQIEGQVIYFYGICEKCLKNGNNNS